MLLLVKPLTTSPDSSADRINRARELFVQMAELSTAAGVPVKAFTSPDLPVFSKNSPEQQLELIKELEARVDLFASAAGEKINLRDTRQMLWRSLRKGGWTPNSDVFDSIGDEDTVEIYSLEMKQIFRNLEFFRWISYTLEEVHGGTWYELVSRHDEAQKLLLDAVMRLVNGEVQTTLDVSFVPNHMCQELKSQDKRKFMIQMKVLSPVFRDGKMVAIIAVNRTRPCE